MPWYLHNGDGSALSNTSLKSIGGRDIWDKQDSYRKPDGSRDFDAFQRDRWAHETLHFVRKRRMLVHCLPAGDGCFLSDQVKSILDEMEPGVHDPIRVSVFTHDGEPYPWFFWHYQHRKLPRVDAIDIERSRVRLDPNPREATGIFESPIVWAGPKPETFLDGRTLGSHHFFRERRSYYSWCFYSDALFDALKSADLLRSFDVRYVGLTHIDNSQGVE